MTVTVAVTDLKLRGGGGGAFVLLSLPAFLPPVIFSYSTQNKGGGDPSPRSATGLPSSGMLVIVFGCFIRITTVWYAVC